jgi:antitoxin HicB
MSTRKAGYPFIVRPLSTEEGGGFLVTFPDLPGCISDGETPEEAVRNGQDALKGYLEVLREFGDPIPKPGVATEASGQWRQRVPKTLHTRLIERAKAEGVSLNSLVTTFIADALGGGVKRPQRPLVWPTPKTAATRAAKTARKRAQRPVRAGDHVR